MRTRGHDALATGVLAGGEARFRCTRADERTVFEIGSVTKPFTGVLLAGMALSGELRLEDPVTDHLPRSQLPRWNERPPTLEELATHRAALPNAPSGIGRGEAMFALGLRSADPWTGVDRAGYHAAVRETKARRPPGGRFGYSSLGYALLGDALAARAGVTYGELLRERICVPLGLAGTGVEPGALQGRSRRGRARPPLHDQMPAAGAIRSSAEDLLRFLAATLEPHGPAFALAARPRVQLNRRMSLGLGWMTLRRKGKPDVALHNGGTWGFRSFAAMVPERGTAVVVLANTARSVDRLGMRLLDGVDAPE